MVVGEEEAVGNRTGLFVLVGGTGVYVGKGVLVILGVEVCSSGVGGRVCVGSRFVVSIFGVNVVVREDSGDENSGISGAATLVLQEVSSPIHKNRQSSRNLMVTKTLLQ